MISLVVCSKDDARWAKFEGWLRRIPTLDVEGGLEVIRVSDARSMCEGYNRGISRANGDLVAFCHDDVEILSGSFWASIRDVLLDHDVVGLAGTDRLRDGTWSTSGSAHTAGQCAGRAGENPEGPYVVSIYGDRFGVIPVQALDGFFFASRRSVLESIKFDEAFDGWHFYDMDFTLRAHLADFDVVVKTDLAFVHHSNATFTEEWMRYRDFFEKKHADHLPSPVERGEKAHRVTLAARTKALVTEIMEGRTAFSREVREQAKETFASLRGVTA